ncbi:MAG: hydantoinase B/oxoprolinase family protein, partial [Halobacteriota archaeon]
MYTCGKYHRTPIFLRKCLKAGHVVKGPAIIIENTTTIVVEPSWKADITPLDHIVLTRTIPRKERVAIGTDADPVMLEVFNNRFMSVAEQMGYRLQNTAHSV